MSQFVTYTRGKVINHKKDGHDDQSKGRDSHDEVKDSLDSHGEDSNSVTAMSKVKDLNPAEPLKKSLKYESGDLVRRNLEVAVSTTQSVESPTIILQARTIELGIGESLQSLDK